MLNVLIGYYKRILRDTYQFIMNCLSDILDIYKDSDKLAIIFVDIEQNEERISFRELNLKLNLVR